MANFCTNCGGDSLVELVEWTATSLEPQDTENMATLQEYDCNLCLEHFWVGVERRP